MLENEYMNTPMTKEEVDSFGYENMMMEQSKRDRRVWEQSELGKQYVLALNQVYMESDVSELGFDEIQKIIQERIKEMNK